jgi:predicted ester cyclase
MSEQNKALLREFLAAGERGQVDQFDNYLTRDSVDHNPFPGQGPGLEGAKQVFAMMKRAVPDVSMPFVEIIAEGDLLAAVGKMKGTQTGDMPGMPASGKPFDVFAIDWARVEAGKFAEHWGVIDFATMARQTGTAPIPPGLENWKPAGGKAPMSGAVGTPDQNKEVVRHCVDLFNSGKEDQLLLLFHPDAVDRTPMPGQGAGRSGWEQKFQMFQTAFTEPEWVIEGQVAEGDLVSNRYRFHGKHTGEIMGMPATNKAFDVSALDMIRVRDGHIVENWTLLDFPAMMQQLGLAEGPPSR